MRPPSASEHTTMKLKPLTVADIAALAACYREIDAASKAGNDCPMMAVAFGHLAGVLDRINLGKRPKAFSDMTLPEFLRAVARVVPDIEAEIVEAVNALRARYDYVFTTGGIGPTHDDITADSIAAAFGVDLVVSPEIAAILERRPAPPEIMAVRMRMARIPRGGGLVDNPLGPPGFYIGNVYVMAGIA